MADDVKFEGGAQGGKSSIAAAVEGAEPAPVVPPDIELAGEPQTDLGNMRRYRARYGHDLICVEELGWLVWDGQRWNLKHGKAQGIIKAHQTVERILDEAGALLERAKDKMKSSDKLLKEQGEKDESKAKALFKWGNKSCSGGLVNAMISAAQPYLTYDPDLLDQEDWVICLNNGELVIDGADNIKLWPHRRDHYNTRLAPVDYDPDADCPRWMQQIADVLPDEATALYLQKVLGYAMTGDMSHQFVTILEGQGSNGKSTILEVVCKILGGYSATAGIETFLHDKNRSGAGPSPDVARLAGVRLIRTSEPEAGVRLSESRLKTWTGGEEITARHMFKGLIDFNPCGKLIISVNVKPTIVGKDDGIRRRIRVVPFKRQFGMVDDDGEVRKDSAPKRNQSKLVDELLEEKSGILNWLLDGLRMVIEDGMEPSKDMAEAHKNYFTEMDPIGQFFAECTRRYDNYVAGAGIGEVDGAKLYKAYEAWCEGAGETAKSKTAFGRRCSDLGYKKRSSNGRILRTGLELEQAWEPVQRGHNQGDE